MQGLKNRRIIFLNCFDTENSNAYKEISVFLRVYMLKSNRNRSEKVKKLKFERDGKI